MSEQPPNPNRSILAEARGLWRHARKTRPIWARQIDRTERIETLEGPEDVPAGNFLCRGEAGDVWPQSTQRLETKYQPTTEQTGDGWRKYLPRPDDTGVMAAPIAHPFAVQAKWGELKGKAGDYLVKNYDDRNEEFPEDVWIVDGALFRATYEPVDQSK
jgi:hypothetical protein